MLFALVDIKLLDPLVKGTTAEAQDKMKSRFLLDVVVCQGTPILQLLPGKDKPLLIWRNSLLVLNLGRAQDQVRSPAQDMG